MVRIVGCEISPPRAYTRRHQPGGQPAGSDREKVAVDAHLLDDAVKALHRRSSPVTMNPPRAASTLVGGACSGCIKPIWRAVWRSAPRCSPRRPAAREQGLASAAYEHTYLCTDGGGFGADRSIDSRSMQGQSLTPGLSPRLSRNASPPKCTARACAHRLTEHPSLRGAERPPDRTCDAPVLYCFGKNGPWGARRHRRVRGSEPARVVAAG